MSYAPSLGLLALIGWAFPPPPVRIDLANPDDTVSLAAIHASSFEQEWSADELAAMIGEPSVICLVARRANAFGTRAPFGFLLMRVAADEAEVLTIAVGPKKRGRGFGRALLMAGIERLIRRDIKALFLEVDVANVSALALYRRIGFIEVGRRKGYYRTGPGAQSSALIMRLDLA